VLSGREVDAAARVVRLRGAPVELSQKEFALVRTLASDPTRVLTKDELLRTIWGFRTLGSNRRNAPCAARVPNRRLAVTPVGRCFAWKARAAASPLLLHGCRSGAGLIARRPTLAARPEQELMASAETTASGAKRQRGRRAGAGERGCGIV
jgi:hypothetical protein